MGRPGRQIAVGAFLFGLTIVGGPALTEPAAIKFVYPPPVAPDVQALPRLDATTPAFERINDQLSQLDAEQKSFAQGCKSDPPRSFVERRVDVVFAGPRYLSLLTLDAFSCPGAAHGNFGTTPLTFDLATGTVVIWSDLFPSGLLDPARHPSWTGHVIGNEDLTTLYLEQADQLDDACFDAIQRENNGYFRIWPSAADRGLALMPTGLAYAIQACADPAVFPSALLRREGFPDDLIAALEAPLPLPQPDTP